MSDIPIVGALGNETGFTPVEGSKLKPVDPGGASKDKFVNDLFEQKKKETKDRLKKIKNAKIKEMTKMTPPTKKLHQLNIKEITIGVKDSWFELLDDVLQLKFQLDTLTKNNRMFFLGISFIIVMIIIYTYDIISHGGDDSSNYNTIDKKIVEHHYIYHNKPDDVIPSPPPPPTQE